MSAAAGFSDFDAITPAQLRAGGGLKWSAYPECIGAFVAEMDFGTAPAVMAALRGALADGQLGYLSREPVQALAEACAQWQRERHGWQLDPGRVQAIPDVLTGLELALRHLLPERVQVLLPTPNYMPFLPLLRQLGHGVHEVPMRMEGGRWCMDLDGIDAAFAAGARLAILCNPHNPVGRVFTESELRAFCAIAGRHGARVFCDEVHSPLVFAPHRHVPYATLGGEAARQAITATSASKGWNVPGLKCAQLILSNDDDLRIWRSLAPLAGHATATPGVIANTAAWREGGPWLARVMTYLEGNRALVGQALRERMPGIGWVSPEGTYLAWLDCRALGLGEAPAARFRRAGVALVDGSECGAAGTGFVRMNFAMPRPILAQALERMATVTDGDRA